MAMDWSSELRVHTVKRRRSCEHPSDQLTKMSRFSFSSRLSGTQFFNHETQSAAPCDFTLPHDVLKTYNGTYSLPVNKVISKPASSDFYITHLNHKIPEVVKPSETVPETEQCSINTNIADTAVTVQRSKENPDQFNLPMTCLSEQELYNTSYTSSNDRGCPDCAAGQSGHIRHIGRWRMMDSL